MFHLIFQMNVRHLKTFRWKGMFHQISHWTGLFLSRSLGMMRESKWYTDFPFIAVKTRKRGALLKTFHFSERCPVEKPVLLVSLRKKKQFFFTNGSLSLKSPKKSQRDTRPRPPLFLNTERSYITRLRCSACQFRELKHRRFWATDVNRMSKLLLFDAYYTLFIQKVKL